MNQQNTEIRFNLMALVPDKLEIFKENLDLLKNNRNKVLNIIESLVKPEELENGNTRQLRSRVSTSQLSTTTTTIVNVNSNSNSSLSSSPSKIDLLSADTSFKFKIKLKNVDEIYFNLNINNEMNEILLNDFEIIKLNTYIVENEINNDLKFKDLVEIEKKIQFEIQYYENKCKEEIEKRNKYKVSVFFYQKFFFQKLIINFFEHFLMV
jgi:hypothetical protein